MCVRQNVHTIDIWHREIHLYAATIEQVDYCTKEMQHTHTPSHTFRRATISLESLPSFLDMIISAI